MSEKRFTFLTGASGVLFYDNEVMIPYPVVVDLLNSQSDALLSYDKLVSDLNKENEQLRKELKWLNRKYIAFSEATDKRLKEMVR